MKTRKPIRIWIGFSMTAWSAYIHYTTFVESYEIKTLILHQWLKLDVRNVILIHMTISLLFDRVNILTYPFDYVPSLGFISH